ncbi:sarcosine oxidase subunit gamma [Demetria terragena]|uniref:sarcosine oxidase subunit gamma n=1 Tax=Demetria terragena TaxID=63959 RepID=UPI00035DA5CA|nr:sarcosine oxidase subunit gamma family protein [Demetria terragena]
MADHLPTAVLDLRRSPAHDLRDEFEAGSSEKVGLREVPFLTQIALRAAPGGPASGALEGSLGCTLPQQVGEVTSTGTAHVLWLAPDEFLLVAPDEAQAGESTTAYAQRLVDALGAHRGQVVDVSANRTTFKLSGPMAQVVLDKSVRIDLDPVAAPIGTALVTELGATPAILWRTDEQEWQVLVRASFAVHVGTWLLDGMREFSGASG